MNKLELMSKDMTFQIKEDKISNVTFTVSKETTLSLQNEKLNHKLLRVIRITIMQIGRTIKGTINHRIIWIE